MTNSKFKIQNLKLTEKRGVSTPIAQLHRLEGQLHGIEKMVQSSAKLSDILQQLEAVQGNLRSLEKKLLAEKLQKHKDEELVACFKYLCKL